jgi:hypothetical protein
MIQALVIQGGHRPTNSGRSPADRVELHPAACAAETSTIDAGPLGNMIS